jgi:hypothetical protein
MLNHNIPHSITVRTAPTHISPILVELVKLHHILIVLFNPLHFRIKLFLFLLIHLLHQIVLVFGLFVFSVGHDLFVVFFNRDLSHSSHGAAHGRVPLTGGPPLLGVVLDGRYLSLLGHSGVYGFLAVASVQRFIDSA